MIGRCNSAGLAALAGVLCLAGAQAAAPIHIYDKVELTYFQCNGPVRQSLYRRRSMGGSQGPELRQTMLRFLGWRPSVPRAHYFIRTGQVDVGERIASIRFWHIQQDRKFCQRRVDRGGEAEQPRS